MASRKASSPEGLNIPTVWIAIVLQLVGLLFFAGSGWTRLGTAETEITALKLKFDRYDEVKERLVKLEYSLASLATSVEKIAVRFESIPRGSPIMDEDIRPSRKR